jgi:hypothetical protein
LALIAAKDKGEKKLFGFAFSPLMRDDGTTLSDDIHELYVYKVWYLAGFIPTLCSLWPHGFQVVFIGQTRGFRVLC